MSIIIHQFVVERDDEEIALECEFEVEKFVRGKYNCEPGDSCPNEGGFAELSGTIYMVDGYGNRIPWDGELTDHELERIQEDAYEVSCEPPDYDRYDDTDDVLYRDFDLYDEHELSITRRELSF